MFNNKMKNVHPTERAGPPPCRLVRKSLLEGFGPERTRTRGLDLDTPWVRRHVAACPRCQRRFAALGRVNLALQLARSQAHDAQLLSRANRQAMKVLQRPLRQDPQADQLRIAFPEPRWWEPMVHLRGHLAHWAACIALLVLGKMGLLGSIKGTQAHTQNTIRSFYTQQLGPTLAEEVFPD